MITKRTIQRCFDRASSHYQRANTLQTKVAHSLLQRLPVGIHSTLLDVGCGPGVNRPALQPRCEHYIGLDLSAAMLNQARSQQTNDSANLIAGQASWLHGDFEAIGLADNSVDVLYSNLAIQWAHQPQAALAELIRVLRPGAPLVASTVLDGSLQPLSGLRSAISGQQGVNPQLSGDDWQQLLGNLTDKIDWHFEQQRYCIYSETLSGVLDGIKGVGAGASNGPRLTVADWRALATRYETHRTVEGLPLWYNIGFIHVYKKS